ncbi:spore wall protein 2-like [Salmo trutta]|uniref:spore wall protein 2-like n=1 Tax=Salmo trutta TaxID=8032 RepID=UPI001131BF53|nr:spore wall protein 2-like [Salmo trutta]
MISPSSSPLPVPATPSVSSELSLNQPGDTALPDSMEDEEDEEEEEEEDSCSEYDNVGSDVEGVEQDIDQVLQVEDQGMKVRYYKHCPEPQDGSYVESEDGIYVEHQDRTYVEHQDRTYVEHQDRTYVECEDRTYIDHEDGTYAESEDGTYCPKDDTYVEGEDGTHCPKYDTYVEGEDGTYCPKDDTYVEGEDGTHCPKDDTYVEGEDGTHVEGNSLEGDGSSTGQCKHTRSLYGPESEEMVMFNERLRQETDTNLCSSSEHQVSDNPCHALKAGDEEEKGKVEVHEEEVEEVEGQESPHKGPPIGEVEGEGIGLVRPLKGPIRR